MLEPNTGNTTRLRNSLGLKALKLALGSSGTQRNCSNSAQIRSSAATSSILYDKWRIDRAFVQVPAQTFVAQWLQSFKEFPIRQKPASFNLDSVMAKLSPTKGPGE